jgi:hypothetical protein
MDTYHVCHVENLLLGSCVQALLELWGESQQLLINSVLSLSASLYISDATRKWNASGVLFGQLLNSNVPKLDLDVDRQSCLDESLNPTECTDGATKVAAVVDKRVSTSPVG